MPIEEDLLDVSLVLAGKVVFPDQAVMGLYYQGVWTLLSQLGALVLKAGVNYTDANFLFLAITPPLLTGALAMFVHGLTGRPLFALVVAITCFMNDHFALFFASADYPLLGAAWNTPDAASYGRIGSVLAAFSIAALIGGRDALAVFTAASLVAIHPVIGAYTATMVAFGLGFARLAWNRTISRPVVLGLAAGASVALLSLAVFLLTRPIMPAVDESMNRAYVEVYLSFWDDHRNQPATRRDVHRLVFAFFFLAVPLLGFLAIRRGRRASADAGTVVLLTAIAVSTVLYVMLHWGRALLPDIVIRGSPGRLINIQAYFAMPLAAGIAVFAADEIARWLHRRRESSTGTAPAGGRRVGTVPVRYPNAIAAAIALALVVWFVPAFVHEIATIERRPSEVDDPFWLKVRGQEIGGLVLAPAIVAKEALRYGRLAIALDPDAIDFIPYIPSLATAVGTMVERGYGVSFFHPPADLKFSGALSPTTGREYWACLSPGQWQRLAREFGITALLVPAGWKARLPLLLSDSNYALYTIPAGEPVRTTAPGLPAESPCPLLRE